MGISEKYRGSSLLIATLLLVAGMALPAQKAAAQESSPFTPQNPEFTQNVKDIYFPFNIYRKAVNPQMLDADADWLKSHPDTHFWIQGFADIRGDIVYNLALSYRRAQWIKSSLMERGVSESQIGFATGWGKLYPICDGSDEDCYQKNRYVSMVLPDAKL